MSFGRRCCSLESPKKLRFAVHHDDGTPVRRRPSGVAEEDEYCCDRHLSVSCPCIDHFDGVDDNDDPTRRRQPVPTTASDNCDGGGRQRSSALYAPPTGTRASGGGGFPRVNSAPVTPMVADCLDMTDMSALSALLDDVNEPLIRDTGGAITFV